VRAVVQVAYGPPERVLRVTDVERPVPGTDALLVRVCASTVTRGDAMGVRGQEYRFTRLFTGIRRPRQPITGSEFAGVVEATGPAVTSFRIGDAVFGIAEGAHAEFVAVRERGVVARKPSTLSFEDAAAVADGSLLALTCLRPAYPLQGKRVSPGLRSGGLDRHGGRPASCSPFRSHGDGGLRPEGHRPRAIAWRPRRTRPVPR
jgi:NADPH:quinone reductase-like Zn-dependent oxidoreductase